MKNKNSKSALYLPPSDQEKIVKLSEEVREEKLKMDRRSTQSAISIGLKLLAAEKLVRKTYGKKKGIWGKFRKDYFEGIETRMSQRYMKIATHTDLDKYPHLEYLSQGTLLRLIGLAEDEDVGKFLTKKKVKFNGKVNPKNLKRIAIFKKAVAELIVRVQKTKKLEESKKSEGSGAGEISSTPSLTDTSVMTSINNVVGFIDSIDSEEEFERKISPLIKAKLMKLEGKIRWLFQPTIKKSESRGKVVNLR